MPPASITEGALDNEDDTRRETFEMGQQRQQQPAAETQELRQQLQQQTAANSGSNSIVGTIRECFHKGVAPEQARIILMVF